jgi:beta-glucosidase-like glycosyl hydrolase
MPGGVSERLPFCNSKLSIPARVADLIGRLSLADKLGLLGSDLVHTGLDTCTAMDTGLPRLGIPPFLSTVNTNSGVGAMCLEEGKCPTAFPSQSVLAASFNRSAWRARGEMLSTEQRAFSNLRVKMIGCVDQPCFVMQLGFGPNIEIVRDPRFGRNSEIPSEDPVLSGHFASEVTRGLQEGKDPSRLKTIAAMKHYAVYSVEDRREARFFNVSLFDLFDTYLAPYAYAFRSDGGNAAAVMSSYSGVNGQFAVCACVCEREAFKEGVDELATRRRTHGSERVPSESGASSCVEPQ